MSWKKITPVGLKPTTRNQNMYQDLIRSQFVALATQPWYPDGSFPTLLTIFSPVEIHLNFPGVLEILDSIAKKKLDLLLMLLMS